MLSTVKDRPNFAYHGDNPDWLVAYGYGDSEREEWVLEIAS